jgi:hypothetical protein
MLLHHDVQVGVVVHVDHIEDAFSVEARDTRISPTLKEDANAINSYILYCLENRCLTTNGLEIEVKVLSILVFDRLVWNVALAYDEGQCAYIACCCSKMDRRPAMDILQIRISPILEQNINEVLRLVVNYRANHMEAAHPEIVDGHIYLDNSILEETFEALEILLLHFL